ncbi:Phospholipase D precursor [Piscirickettsia salmonis]|uniref:phospholipase D-like domain-containing protein n=4 Tax=Piscirickettsia salmonis TaxID=1238 RepID=UPI0012BA585A|nr:phospholipase D-like domain-containing protein [Piscirickettsia salmonis]QGP55155.1 Phospholipase D precursor [Piscirickettsia salmonis]QGP58986.1 Phospholipase D precursor [Piscirickettsia salmonis]QGP64720.1 Phospholipase D precursor [Piscirickettsia salmonis]
MTPKTLLLFFPIIFYINFTHASILNDIYQDIIDKTDTSHQQEGITYNLTQHNLLKPDFLIQFPGKEVWGIKAETYPGYNFNRSLDNNFGLPHCNSQSQCITNSSCSHLQAFYNGLADKNTKMCNGYADQKLDRLYTAINSAQHFIDITTLESLPDLKFRSTIRNALTVLATTGRKITVRILDGLYEPIPTVQVEHEQIAASYLPNSYTTQAFLKDLIKDIKKIPSSNLDIYVAGMRTCSGICRQSATSQAKGYIGYMSLSWNHSKIINIDGNRIITGGVNMFSTNYLMKRPVFDLMMELQGPTANKTLGFTNLLWDFVKHNIHNPFHVIEYSAKKANQYKIIKSDLPENLKATNTPLGNTEVLAVGKTGKGLYYPESAQENNTSDYALYDLLSKAQHTIYLAQQSIKASLNTWPLNTTNQKHSNFISALAKLLMNKGSIYLVTSPYDTPIPMALGYASLATSQEAWDKIKSEALAMYPNTQEAKINQLLCKNLHIATIRFNGTDTTWPNNKKIYDHYKFMMVDDQLFYIGSQNFYPSGLQNYGYIIDDTQAAATIKQEFWNNLWKYSSKSEYTPKQCKTSHA